MFKELNLKPVYTSEQDNIPRDFYCPVLKQAKTFDRTSAYFSAKALSMYSEGLEFFANKGQKYRLIISQDVSEEDFIQIKSGYALRREVLTSMVNSLRTEYSIHDEKNLSNLAYFIARGTVDIKIAFKEKGIFHDKCGILLDDNGDALCFRGSNNETEAAIQSNYESFQVTCSWLDSTGFYTRGIDISRVEFEKLWNNEKDDLVVLPADEVILKEIIRHNKGKIIVEEVLLRHNTVVLDYDGNLILHINTENTDWLINKTFFRSRLKYLVENINGNMIIFKSNLAYPEYEKINTLLESKIPSCGYEYTCTQRLKDYIKSRNIYIEKRAKLGIELKTDASYLSDKYEKFKETVAATMVRKLREKQMQDAFFMFSMLKSGNFSVPGSGKTSSALAVFSFLRVNDLVDRIVMIGPKNSFGSWVDEFKACFGNKQKLKYFNVQDGKYRGPSEKRYALKYEAANTNLFLFNYEGVGTYIDEVKHIVSSRTLLIFDEVHKVKAINGQHAIIALEIAKCASYIIAMTGTPIPNSYLDIYNLLHILYSDEYDDFFGFSTAFLKAPDSAEIQMINIKIQPFFCRTTKQQLQVPEANKDIISQLYVSEKEKELFQILCNKYHDNKLALFIRILQLESNPEMLLQAIDLSDFSKVLDISDDIDEIDIVDYSADVKKLISDIGLTVKKRTCLDLVCDLVNEGKKVIVWCIFKNTIYSLQSELSIRGVKAKYIMGEVPLEERQQLIEDYRNGVFDVLITNPHTLAESVSLHSVCHDAIYFEYSYNLVHLLQSKDRIHRLGLPEGQYTQYYFLQDFYEIDSNMISIDEKVYNRLKEKESTMLDAIDNQVLEPVYTSDEDLDVIFGGVL